MYNFKVLFYRRATGLSGGLVIYVFLGSLSLSRLAQAKKFFTAILYLKTNDA
jgi:hypothetical protein